MDISVHAQGFLPSKFPRKLWLTICLTGFDSVSFHYMFSKQIFSWGEAQENPSQLPPPSLLAFFIVLTIQHPVPEASIYYYFCFHQRVHYHLPASISFKFSFLFQNWEALLYGLLPCPVGTLWYHLICISHSPSSHLCFPFLFRTWKPVEYPCTHAQSWQCLCHSRRCWVQQHNSFATPVH